MNLFRSEEDARRDRFSGHYVSSSPSYSAAFFAKLREVTGGSPYWEPPVT